MFDQLLWELILILVPYLIGLKVRLLRAIPGIMGSGYLGEFNSHDVLREQLKVLLLLSLVCVLAPAIAFSTESVSSVGGMGRSKIVLYASVGEELFRFDVDFAGATLIKRDSVKLTANVQYAVTDHSRHYLYVVSSDAGSGVTGAGGTKHILSAYRI
jgi:hypothetical protein